MKKDGGIIDNYQIHTLSHTQEDIEKVFPGENVKPIVFTGTVVSDPTGRWNKGYHMRSSLIVNIDKEEGIIETRNTIYKVFNEGKDYISETMAKILGKDSSDLGDDVLKIHY